MFKKILKSYFLLSTFMILTAGFSSSAHAETSPMPEPDQYVQVRLIADKTTVSGGETIHIGIEETIHPKWHTYWKNPGDSGTPTDIEWDLPPEFSVSELEWPAAQKIPFGPLTNYGYENQVVLLQNLTLPENIGSSAFVLNAKVNLLVCHDICIPETHDVWIKFNGDNAAEPEKIKMAEATLPITQDWKSTYYQEGDDIILRTIVEDVSDFNNATNITILPEDWGALDNNAAARLTLTNAGFNLSQKKGERNLGEISELPYVVTYTNAANVEKAIRLVATPAPIQAAVAPIQQSSINIFQALLFALLGGIVLNLMPCVFPVLSMKALSLINLKGKEESKARGYGIAYTLGILISFVAIGGTLLLLKAGGAQIGWGFQLQNPIVITLLAYLVFIIGLNLAGFFEFSTGLGNIGQGLTQRNDRRGAFFTGVLATLVATPCTAPFMGAALGFALTQPAAISMLVFLALGFGLALPYLALCFVPALRSKLPRPGAWMETFRNFLAFPMFITAAWLLWVLFQQISPIGVFCALIGAILIAFAIWLYRVMPTGGVMRKVSQGMLIISVIFAFGAPFITNEVTKDPLMVEAGQNWGEFSPQKLSALLEGDQPVFTNMTAAWCITCKVNERVALKKDSVEAIFADNNIQYLKGDWTNQNPEITQYLNSFGRNGVPLYVYYPPRDTQSGTRPDPIVLPQILTAGLVEKTIQ